MPRDSNGNYTLPAGNPVVPATTISTAWGNPTMNDLGQGIQDSLDRFGRGGMLAPLKFADGIVGIPGFAWTNEPATGFYRAGAGDMRNSVLAADRMRWTSTGVDLWDASAPAWVPLITTATGASSFGGLSRANTWTQNQTFTTAGVGINIEGVRPRIQWWENDQIADEGRWRLDLNSKIMNLSCVDDAISSTRSVFTFTRGVGTEVSSLVFGNSNNNPSYTFAGSGTTSFVGAATFAAGSLALPSIAFTADPDTGFWWQGAQNDMRMSAGAIQIWRWYTLTGNRFSEFGDGLGPCFFSLDGNAGGNRALRFKTAASTRWEIRADAVAESGGNVGSNLDILAYDDAGGGSVVVCTINRSDFQVELGVNSNSTAARPGITFQGDTDTGYYRSAANVFGISSGGVATEFSMTNVTGLLEGGSYTPVTANIANTISITPSICYFQRVGSNVFVQGIVTINPTASLLTRISVSVPIAPANFTQVVHATGCGSDNSVAVVGDTQAWEMFAITGGALVELRCAKISGTFARPVRFSFSYRM